jgi:hypothetical protein
MRRTQLDPNEHDHLTAPQGAWLRWTPPADFPWNSTKRVGGATDAILDDVYDLTGVGVYHVKITRNPDGGINWTDHGPHNDPEFMNCLNRHSQWEDLVKAWHATGNEASVAAFLDPRPIA